MPKSVITTTATAYGGCTGNRCSANAVDGDTTCSEATAWGSWECSSGHSLCTLGLSWTGTRVISRVVIQQCGADVPASLRVLADARVAYDGAAQATMTVTVPVPAATSSISITETAYPPNGNWWTVAEVDLYECRP